jgi:hypothetical protein
VQRASDGLPEDLEVARDPNRVAVGGTSGRTHDKAGPARGLCGVCGRLQHQEQQQDQGNTNKNYHGTNLTVMSFLRRLARSAIFNPTCLPIAGNVERLIPRKDEKREPPHRHTTTALPCLERGARLGWG